MTRRARRTGRQLGFEFTGQGRPSVATVELAAVRARAASLPRMHQDGSPSPPVAPAQIGLSGASLPGVPDTAAAPALAAAADQADLGSCADHADLASALELLLRGRFGAPLRLTVTDNRRTMVSLRRPKNDELVEVRLHHMFLLADQETWDALGNYLVAGDRAAAVHIARYIEQNRRAIRRPQRRPLALSAAGAHHDLQAICRSVDERYFGGQAQVNITWSRENTARPSAGRRSIKLGSYTSRDRLIRVHPALDAAFVPRFFVEYIVYHEMLHHVLPPQLHNGRRQLHGPSFRARERQFQDYHAALRWERENLDKLLRTRAARPVAKRP